MSVAPIEGGPPVHGYDPIIRKSIRNPGFTTDFDDDSPEVKIGIIISNILNNHVTQIKNGKLILKQIHFFKTKPTNVKVEIILQEYILLISRIGYESEPMSQSLWVKVHTELPFIEFDINNLIWPRGYFGQVHCLK